MDRFDVSRKIPYSRNAFIRRAQMSHDKSIFLVVEGRVNDPYFANKLCSSSEKISRAGFKVLKVEDIGKTNDQEPTGGKDAVLALFAHCKNMNKLEQKNKKGKVSFAFLLDRDMQHITGGRRRSKHISYTHYADTEAHIFFTARQRESIMLAASLDQDSVLGVDSYLESWYTELANDWRPWIEACYVAEATHSRSWVKSSHPKSLVHTGKDNRTLDSQKLDQAYIAIRSNSPLNDSIYEKKKRHVLEKIEAVYSRGEQKTLLKGKWIPPRLAEAMKKFFKESNSEVTQWHDEAFGSSLTRCFSAHIDTGKKENARIIRRIEDLI
ncbi:hypothetical protein [Nocardiopsis alba]|uniref:hypothetical protein n=1 Tax=Nocardiopsis alba TaxID=53437 RepID=UPI0035DCE02E